MVSSETYKGIVVEENYLWTAGGCDIRAYVESTIGQHEIMGLLLAENEAEASTLVEMLLSIVSGIFLWARLVVKLLLDRFQDYDRVFDLKGRVDKFPAELGSPYTHIFHSMGSRHQTNGAQLSCVGVRSLEV